MCTAMSISSTKNYLYFGRTMDFSYELDPEVYVSPSNFEWNNSINNTKINNKYKFIGTGQNLGKITFADGFNEKGLAIAALYFQGFAQFSNYIDPNKLNIGSVDLVNFILGNCSDIEDIKKIMKDINVVGIEDLITHSVAPLHWIAVDKLRNCITIEITKDGLEIFNNPLKILANSPNFQWHMTNLRNYMNLSTSQIQETTWDNISLIPFGQGTGTFGLPGDYTSPSRFVRTAFLKSCISPIPQNVESINMCFNIMKGVTIPRGIVMTSRGTYDYTQYTVFFNLFTGDYYFNTQNNNNILTVNISDSSENTITSLGKLNQVSTFEKLRK